MDKYHIFNEIGAGKNSQVFKGRQKKTVTYVAVKRVAKDQMSKVVNEARSRRFEVLRRLHAIDATRVHQRAESSDRDAPRRLPSRRRWSSTRSRTRRL